MVFCTPFHQQKKKIQQIVEDQCTQPNKFGFLFLSSTLARRQTDLQLLYQRFASAEVGLAFLLLLTGT